MYVRTWKDTDMVATSDSNPTGSASDGEPDAAADVDTTASGDVTETPSEPTAPPAAASPSQPAPSQPTPPPAAAASAPPPRTTDTHPGPPRRTRPRRDRPTVSRSQVTAAVNGVRERLAAIVWIIAVVFAAILAAGALLIALDANPNNDLVEQVVDWAGGLDGPFRDLFTFDGDNAATKAALVNWGLAALAWLVGGRIVSSIIRP
jgi:hypothetical protein